MVARVQPKPVSKGSSLMVTACPYVNSLRN